MQEDAAPLQNEAQELLAYANTDAATQDELEIAQRRIMEIEEELALQMAAEQDVFVAEQNMKSILAEALRRNLEAHAEEEGIDFILNWGLSGEGVLYGSEPWDITTDVLERINSDHDSRRPQKTGAHRRPRALLLANGGPRAGLPFQPAVLESWAEQHAWQEGTDPQAEIDWILNVAKALRRPAPQKRAMHPRCKRP